MFLSLLAIVFVIICVLLIVVVLLQKGRGGGMGGILGGGSGHTAFGTRTGDVFTWVTIFLVGVFLLLAIGANKLFRPKGQSVSTPICFPPAMPISKPISVRIRCDTPRAEIFYTVGTITDHPADPTRSSMKFDVPVRIAPGSVLKARAYLSGRKESKVQVNMYPLPSATTSTAPAPPASGPSGTTSRPATTPADTAPAR